MSTVLETNLSISTNIRAYSNRNYLTNANYNNFSLCSRVDLINPELKARVDSHKWCRSKDSKMDLGICGVVDYFVDNPSQLPKLEDKRSEWRFSHGHCKYRQSMETILLPIAVERHQILMGITNDKPITYNDAWEDFKRYYEKWKKRVYLSTCICLCENAEHCESTQELYRELELKKQQGLALIPTLPDPKPATCGLTFLTAISKNGK